MLGYCGINCDNCLAFRGTVNTDRGLLERAAGTYQEGAYSAEQWACLGCLPADQAFLAESCARCRIRICAAGKAVQNCAACGEFEGCPTLQPFVQGEGEELVERMRLLRTRFLGQRSQARGQG